MTVSSKRILRRVLAGALLLAGLFAYLRSNRSGTEPTVLHVGDQRGAIHALLQASGELDHVPYRIDWATFAVGAPLVEAMKAGAVDFGYVGSSTMTFGLASGAPLKAINVWRFGGPGSGILVPAHSGITSVGDLRGKRIAVVRGSPGHMLVVQALKRAGVPLDSVTIINLAAGDAKAALSSGSVDAWSIWDPYLAIGQLQDHQRVIATSEQVSPEVECGVATEQAIRTKRAALTDFMTRVARAFRWGETHPDAVARVYAQDTGLPLDIARFARGRMHVTVLPRVDDASIATHQRGADLFAEIGLIPHRIDVAGVYDRRFILPQ